MSKKNIYVLLVLVLIIIIAGVLRLTTKEDTWLCQNNVWVKHGNPSDPQPTSGCGEINACPEDAKICPDGSSVGRQGPNCEFAACPAVQSETNEVTFVCKDNKSIQAKFYPKKDEYVDLNLSDGRTWQLPHVISASGARYANTDESLVFWNKGDTAFITENNETTFVDCVLQQPVEPQDNIGMANPAATNCLAKGGKLETRKNKNGEYGVCLFDDNRQCEEWAFFRGQCPLGGLKVTGYENEAQVYCVITGGTVEGVGTESVMCKRFDGTYCEVTANFNGECPDPNNPEPNAGNVEAP